jgi:hypothetical protein
MNWILRVSISGRGKRLFFFSQNIQVCSETHLFNGAGFFPWGRAASLEAHKFHPVLKLRMSGVIPLFPICALIAYTDTALPVTFLTTITFNDGLPGCDAVYSVDRYKHFVRTYCLCLQGSSLSS